MTVEDVGHGAIINAGNMIGLNLPDENFIA